MRAGLLATPTPQDTQMPVLLARLVASVSGLAALAILEGSWSRVSAKAAATLILSSYSIRHPLELKIGKYAHIGKIYERERL
jgi:hypothetical protein